MLKQTFIIQTDTPEQESALKAFVKALKMKFEISKEKTHLLSNEQKKAIDEAITSIDANGAIKHKAVMEDTVKRYPHLFNR